MSPSLECEGDGFPIDYGSRDTIIRADVKKERRRGQIKRADSCSSWDRGPVRERHQAEFGLSGGAAMRCSTLLLIFTVVLLYLVMGALVFRALEAPLEEKEHAVLMDQTRGFLFNNSCIDLYALNDYVQKVLEAVGAGVDAEAAILNKTFATNWDVASALFFSGTIMTTIGYGNISPKSDGGKLFCICFALVGIPMFGILLAGVGDHLGTGLRNTVAKIEKLFLKWRISPTIVRVISAILSILLGCLLFLALPTLVFQEVENWSLLESAYFVVITLTTVGFGDYVAGEGEFMTRIGENILPEYWYKPLVWFWILLGLAYFASVLTMIGNWLRVLSKKTRAEMEELRAHATDWTQNIQNMSVDFRIPGNLEDPFKRRRRKRRHRSHGHSHGHGHSHSANGAPGEKQEQNQSQTESGSYSSSYSSSESESGSESETDSRATQTDRVPATEAPPDLVQPQPLDYLAENFAFIDESSDAQSGKIQLEPVQESKQPNSRQAKRRRHRRPTNRKSSKTNYSNNNKRQPNGNTTPVPDLPKKPLD
ncbi:potassium channel subfamily K member 4 isoform X1 [Xiphophorus couchianus]|uniref:potassium channel subfamily K member 4 isoform X1 n=2 Tax=Xiphophorus couchianus TaxID=32473 RepID=UPI001016F685|nr:potassium channel subfamily K member 4-like isoform X1 [Xiphophorus couchianus]